MSPRTVAPTPHLLTRGVAAGLGLVVADGLATGLGRLPFRLALLSLALALLLGIAAALLARLAPRSGRPDFRMTADATPPRSSALLGARAMAFSDISMATSCSPAFKCVRASMP